MNYVKILKVKKGQGYDWKTQSQIPSLFDRKRLLLIRLRRNAQIRL